MTSFGSRGIAAVLLMLSLWIGSVAQSADSKEDMFWNSVKQSDAIEEYRVYVEHYPNGKHIGAAWRRIGQLEAEERSALAARREADARRQAEEEAARREEDRRRAEADALRPGKVFKDCAECPEMAVIPAGRFEMGSDSLRPGKVPPHGSQWGDAERPAHQVTIGKAFALARTEVTQKQWRLVMEENPSHYRSCGENCPVENISRNDVQEFLRRLSAKTGKAYRLPTEAEWEYACLAGSDLEFCGSDDLNAVGSANPGLSSLFGESKPVGLKRSNAWGLFDMSGSVLEMVEDCWHANYLGAPIDGSAWIDATCSSRVIRGGFWGGQPFSARSKSRGGEVGFILPPSKFVGFRPARMLP